MSSLVDFTNASSKHDFIIDTSDAVRLYVLKSFLCYSSDFFNYLFTDSTPEQIGEAGTWPIFKIAEHSSTMLSILPFCYPGTPPPPYSFDGLLEVLLTIRKYLMQDVETRFEAALLASRLTSEEPLRMFAIAVHCKWEGLARGAAKETLVLPLRDELPFVQELELIPASAYRHLLAYHSACSTVAVDALDPPALLRLIGGRPGNPSICASCGAQLVRQFVVLPSGSRGESYGHPWNFLYAEKLREQVRKMPGRVHLAPIQHSWTIS